MRILQVTMQFGRSYTQGTERYVAVLSDGLRRHGHDVTVLAGDPLGLGPRRRLGEPIGGEPHVLHYPTRGWLAIVGLPPRRLAGWLRHHRPDVVHLNTPAHIGAGILSACRRLGIPSVVTVHDYWWICPKATLLRPDGRECDGTPGWPTCTRCLAGDHPRPWVRRLAALPVLGSYVLVKLFMMRAALRGLGLADMYRWMWRRRALLSRLERADFVIFPSQAVAMAVASRLSHDRWRILRNGLSNEWFENPRPPAGQVKEPADLVVGFAGALSPHKGPHVLLEALRHLDWRQTRVRLAGPVGDDTYMNRLRALADGLNVEFAGSLPAHQMPAFLRGLDVLAMTSLWPENCPYAVLEAQAAGVPVVGSRAGGVAELIADERLLFEPGSAEGLAAALNYVRRHPGAARPTHVPTAREMTEAVEKIYQEVTRCVTGAADAP